ncbi:MAG TPA: hypothetical protein DCM64_12080 [Gammaproteobacteria bacterium]|jgi:hypothetical protein|nr:hypothetical protein [Arenicellales bacterium]HAJ77177.1 hypothetical protein [Gammaproteobacteria bacterium]|tara:strand:+ start:634 stop:870 length:237 start_codon:yes stop_codon:yes gene_type:complete
MTKDKKIHDKDLENVSGGRGKTVGRKTAEIGPDFGVEDVLGADEKTCSCSCGCTSSGTWTSNKKTWTNDKKKSAKDGK